MAKKVVIDRVQVQLDYERAPETAMYSQKEISAVTGLTESKLEHARWAGNSIPYLKIGRRVFYRKADVNAWLGQFKPQTSSSEVV
jgi:hypothetical protein